MSDKDIEIGIKTTGDVSGIEKVEKSLQKLDDTSKKTGGGKKGGLLGIDLTDQVGGAGQGAADLAGFGSQFSAVKTAIGADAAAVASSFVAIGAAAAASYKLLSGTVTGYKDLMKEAAAEGISLGDEVEDQVKALEDSLAPLTGVIDFVSERWEALVQTVTSPIDSLSGLGDLKGSLDAAKKQMEELNKLRLKIATENQGELKSIYDGELEKLKEQEQTLQRISRLRAELGGQENRAAALEVESTRLRGGDVALAEANALATQLRTGLDSLGEKLRESQAVAVTTTREYDAAQGLYQKAIRDELDKVNPAKFKELSEGVNTAKQALDDANQAVSDQQRVYEASKNNLIQSTENSLARLEQEYDGKSSAAATKAFDGIYQSLQTAFAEGPKAALEAIKVNTAAFTEATSSKAAEVATGIDQLQSGAVQQTEGLLEKTGQANESISSAVARLDTGISTLSGNVDKLLGIGRDLASIAGRQADHISNLVQQVQALQMRR